MGHYTEKRLEILATKRLYTCDYNIFNATLLLIIWAQRDQLVSKGCYINRKLGLFSSSLYQQAFMILATVGGGGGSLKGWEDDDQREPWRELGHC